MIGELLAKYFDDLSVDDINDLLKALGFSEEIVDFIDTKKELTILDRYTEKLYRKKNGNYLNIKFEFFEPSDKKLKFMALNLSGANDVIKRHQLDDNNDDLNVESIVIVKEPIKEKHKNTITVVDEDFTIPIFSLDELNTIANDKVNEKLLGIKDKDVNEFLNYYLLGLDKDETNDLLKFLCMNVEIAEVVDINYEGFNLFKTSNGDYLNIVLRYKQLDDEFVDEVVDNLKKIAKELNIDKEICTLSLVIGDMGEDLNSNDVLNDVNQLDAVIKNPYKKSDNDEISRLSKKNISCERIEDLKVSFGDILDEVFNIEAIFSLLDKDIEIKTFLDFNFENNDNITNHKVAIDNKHQLLNLVLYFGEVSEEFLNQEAENARKISKQLNNSSPIKTYVILVSDSVNEKICNVDLGEDGIYEVEFCPLCEVDVGKHMDRLIEGYCS